MQNKIISKALSLTAAAVLGCTGVIGSGGWMMTGSAAEIVDYSNDELFPVVIQVSGDAVLATQEGEEIGADFLETDQASQISDRLENVQERVQRAIRSFYPELDVKFSYSTLINGFYCELPESLIPRVKELSNVVGITKLDKDVKLQMASAPQISGYPAYYDMTGCTGEGSVVAVIDSELYADHPMFSALADDVETKLSREDIDAVINSGELNIDITTDQAYRSNKLPFIASYADTSDPTNTENEYWYHGTHVSGIAAGNEFEDADGKLISGIAKDAQLIFFRVSTDVMDIDFGAAIAATEDAVKLGADVINMSWGIEREYFGIDPFAEAITTAENAGVMVCMAAANADNGADSYGALLDTKYPDLCTITDKAEKGQASLVVASADNCYSENLPTFNVGENQIVYGPYSPDFMNLFNMFDILGLPEVEYVYGGSGSEEELAALDLEGKVLLVDFNPEDYDFVLSRAAEHGAIGLLFIDQEIPTGITYGFLSMDIPAGAVSYEDGQAMKEAENKLIVVTGETIQVDHATKVSSYTSWGVKQSLDLRPDIMGVGGMIESAGYADATETMSGTSMATPYLCGCVAEIMQYLRMKESDLTGKEKIEYIHNLLMNSAYPYAEDYDGETMYVSPRRQGAGMVSLENAIQDKVFMLGDEGVAKVNLYDMLGDSFDFNVNLQNLSDEDVTFTSAKLALTTDGYYYDEDNDCNIISGQISLNSSADLSGLTEVAAHDTKSVGISVSLDADQTASLKEVFENGFFVEGYIILEGAENCCDISIPILGYYGDWAQVPIFSQTLGVTQFGNGSLKSGFPIAERVNQIQEIMDNVSPEDLAALSDEFDGVNLYSVLTPEQIEELGKTDDVSYISPNGDGVADRIGLFGEFVRLSQYKYALYNADGENVTDLIDGMNESKYDYNVFEAESDLSALPEGDYKLVLAANIDYASSYENPQIYEVAFTIDKTAPEVTSEIVENDGRKILKLTATDDKALDGVYISGNGFGGVVGKYDPENPVAEGYSAMAAFQEALGFASWLAMEHEDFNDAALPLAARMLSGTVGITELDNNNFFDVIAAAQDEDGNFTLEYDVTDLKNYSVSVADKAGNFVETEAVAVKMFGFEPGLWYGPDGLYEIHKGTIRFADYFDGDSVKYNYTIKGDTLTMLNRNKEVSYQVESLGKTTVRLTDENGVKKILNKMEGYYDMPSFRTAWEIEQAVVSYTKRMLPYGIENVKTVVNNPEEVVVSMVINVEDIQHIPVSFYASMFSNEVYTPFSWFPEDVFIIPVNLIMPGTYMNVYGENDETEFYQFSDDGQSGTIYSTGDADPVEFTYTYNDDETITFDIPARDQVLNTTITTDENNNVCVYLEDGSMLAMYMINDIPDFIEQNGYFKTAQLAEMAVAYENALMNENFTVEDVNYYSSNGRANVEFPNGAYYSADYLDATGYDANYWYVDLKVLPTAPNLAFTLEEFAEMAAKDYEQKTGVKPLDVIARPTADGKVVISIEVPGEYYSGYEIYTLDGESGVGHDSQGNIVNLPETGNNAPASAVAAAAALMLMMVGAGATAGSGVLRKKKETE